MLKSNSLFIDSEYKCDCENKIDYFQDFPEAEESESGQHQNNIVSGIVNIENESDNAGLYIDDGYGVVYPVRRISNRYAKIILDFVIRDE